ncbi:MAG: hypothetical protein JO325_00285 [Solirubrobacterales bacterium]|nr:hypothetical protein [Solirubrobacterales bacterium]
MSTPRDNDEVAIVWRLGRVALVMGGLVAAVVAGIVVALSTGFSLPAHRDDGQTTQVSDRTALAVQQEAADKQWASSACASILNWKNDLHHDETSTNLGFGPVARVQNAIAATKNMLTEVDKLGPPPGVQAARARADLSQIRSELEDGNLPGPQIAGELRNLVSVDLGLSLVETRACRELVGSPI